MEKNNKTRFAILAVFILIAIALKTWLILADSPPITDFSTNLAATIVGLSIIPMVYKIAKKATGSTNAGLFSAALSIAIPLYNWRTVGHLSHTLAIGFFFLTILLFAHLKEIGDWKKIIVVPLIFAFTHIYSILLIPVFGLYFLFSKLESKKLNKNEIIFAGLSSLFIVLIFLFFTATPAFFAIVKQYAGTHYYTLTTENFTLIKAFALAGMIPIYLGFMGTYFGLKIKKKVALLILSIISVSFLAMIFNASAFALGLPYFTVSLATMAGFVYSEFERGIETSKFKKFNKQIAFIIFIIVILFGILHQILS